MDETYAGQWKHLYRAVDRAGDTLNFFSLPSERGLQRGAGNYFWKAAVSFRLPQKHRYQRAVRQNLEGYWRDAGAVASGAGRLRQCPRLVEALRRAGRNPKRGSFIDSNWSLKRYDLAGFEVSISDSVKNVLGFVELAMVSRDGRVIR